MNWKAILVGGVIGFALVSFFGYATGAIGYALAAIFAIISGFIGGVIAGMLSPEDAWKNGLGAGAVLTIGNVILACLYIAYGRVDLPSHNPTDAIVGFIPVLITYSILGAIGGFAGGKIRRKLL